MAKVIGGLLPDIHTKSKAAGLKLPAVGIWRALKPPPQPHAPNLPPPPPPPKSAPPIVIRCWAPNENDVPPWRRQSVVVESSEAGDETPPAAIEGAVAAIGIHIHVTHIHTPTSFKGSFRTYLL